MNNEEIAQYQEMQAQEKANKPEGLADIDKYQTKLPFKELRGTYETVPTDWAEEGYKDIISSAEADVDAMGEE
jgi:hypothetical protein